jgi:hypothetical protein
MWPTKHLRNHRAIVLQTMSSETRNSEAIQIVTQSREASG